MTAPIALESFFQSSRGFFLGDPQAFFDPTTGRWFFTIFEQPFDFAKKENLDIAVSETSDPLGSYFIYHVEAFGAGLLGCAAFDCLPDYPKVGYDANGLYISVNLFGFEFVGAATYALPKSKLEAGASFTYVRIVYPGDFVVQPSVPAPGEPFATAANGTEYLMEARNIFDRSHNIRVWAISTPTISSVSLPPCGHSRSTLQAKTMAWSCQRQSPM